MFDLTENYTLVERIVHSKFSGYSLDSDDLVQEVCFKIHRQNLGENQYDPDRASESRYVYMIAESIVRRSWQKSKNDPVVKASDLSTEYQERAVKNSHFEKVLLASFKRRLAEESEALADIFDLTVQGYSRREIAAISPYTEYRVRQEREKIRMLLFDEVN